MHTSVFSSMIFAFSIFHRKVGGSLLLKHPTQSYLGAGGFCWVVCLFVSEYLTLSCILQYLDGSVYPLSIYTRETAQNQSRQGQLLPRAQLPRPDCTPAAGHWVGVSRLWLNAFISLLTPNSDQHTEAPDLGPTWPGSNPWPPRDCLCPCWTLRVLTSRIPYLLTPSKLGSHPYLHLLNSWLALFVVRSPPWEGEQNHCPIKFLFK